MLEHNETLLLVHSENMRGCTSLVDPYPPPTRVLGGRGTPSHFPHGFGLGAGVRGSPLPHTTAMMWYAQIWCDTMWFTVLYFIDIMWKYVKIYESLKYVKTCQNNVMCKHVLPWSSSNVTHLSTIHGSISFWNSEWEQRILWTFWKRTSALEMNKTYIKLPHLSTVVDKVAPADF